VTGASGQAGRAVVHELLEHGYDVAATDLVATRDDLEAGMLRARAQTIDLDETVSADKVSAALRSFLVAKILSALPASRSRIFSATARSAGSSAAIGSGATVGSVATVALAGAAASFAVVAGAVGASTGGALGSLASGFAASTGAVASAAAGVGEASRGADAAFASTLGALAGATVIGPTEESSMSCALANPAGAARTRARAVLARIRW